MATPDLFKQQYAPVAAQVGQALGVDPDVLLGQWGLETGWGKSVIPGTNNLGNIKDMSGAGAAATDNATGSRDNYRAYASPEEFGMDYVGLLAGNPRYKGALGAGSDPAKFAAGLQAGGYAQDPDYVRKVGAATQLVRQAGGIGDRIAAAVLPSADAAPTGNPFDQFDSAPPAQAVASAAPAPGPTPAAEANPFDQFDEPSQASSPVAETVSPDGVPQYHMSGPAVPVPPGQAPAAARDGGSKNPIVGAIEGLGRFGRGAYQGLTDIPAAVGQNSEHLRQKELAGVDSLLGTNFSAGTAEDVARADQQAQQREADYQAATPGSVMAGLGRVVGGSVPTIGVGGGLITQGAKLGRAGATALGAQLGTRGAAVLGSDAAQSIAGMAGRTAGSSALGALFGSGQPASQGPGADGSPAPSYADQKAGQLGTGAAIGALFPLAGRAVAGAGKAVATTALNLLKPLSESGQTRIANQLIQDTAGNGPRTLDITPHVAGSKPTLAQATANPGLAALERGLRNDPRFINEITAIDKSNAAARNTHFANLSGTPDDIVAGKQAMDSAVADLYSQSKLTHLKVDDDLRQILNRPSMKPALTRAQNLAKERGAGPIITTATARGPMGGAYSSSQQQYIGGTGLHYLKMAIDDMASGRVGEGIGNNEKSALLGTQNDLLHWFEARAPEYGTARETYSAMAKPLDAMQSLQGLRLTDARGNITLNKVVQALASLTRQRAMPGIQPAKLITDTQMQALDALRSDLERADNSKLGSALGSPTMQNISIDNLLSGALPFGTGKALAKTSLGGLIRRAGDALYGKADAQVRGKVADRLFDPVAGQAALNADTSGLAAKLAQNPTMQRLIPYVNPAASVLGIDATTRR